MPSFFNLEFSVVRFKPSRAAAPFAPAMTPLVSRSTRRICSRSVVSSVASSSDEASGGRSSSAKRRSQGRAFCKDHRALDEILEFSDIARPIPLGQRLHHVGRDGLDLLIHAASMLGDEIAN